MIVKITTNRTKDINIILIHLTKGGCLRFEYKGDSETFNEYKNRFLEKYNLVKITRDNVNELSAKDDLFGVEYRTKKSKFKNSLYYTDKFTYERDFVYQLINDYDFKVKIYQAKPLK